MGILEIVCGGARVQSRDLFGMQEMMVDQTTVIAVDVVRSVKLYTFFIGRANSIS